MHHNAISYSGRYISDDAFRAFLGYLYLPLLSPMYPVEGPSGLYLGCLREVMIGFRLSPNPLCT